MKKSKKLWIKCRSNKKILKIYQKMLTLTILSDILLTVSATEVAIDMVDGRLAQLVRASALQAGGHRFESYIAHH